VPFDLFDWLARVLPGRLISAGIDAMVRIITLLGLGPIDAVAKRIEQLLGISIVIGGGAVLGLIMAVLMRWKSWPGARAGLLVASGTFLILAAIEIDLATAIGGNPLVALLWLAAMTLGWGMWMGACLSSGLVASRQATMDEVRAARRALLVKLAGGSIGTALAAWGIGRLFEPPSPGTTAGRHTSALGATTVQAGGQRVSATAPPAPGATAAATREQVPPAPGTRPELTPNKDFYRIDIDTWPPAIDKASWVLKVDGLFTRPRPLTYADLLAFPAVTQPITLCCISNPIGGDLISTSNWTGVPLRVVLRNLGLRPEATALLVRAADGFYESVTLEDMLDPRTLLVYAMNDEPLPVEHGFPLRIYIPNRYGMKQPKWITSIEAINHPGPGYWVDRGWSAEARPQILSIIDTVVKDHLQDGRIPVGGIAWAGDRGIRKVEVQVDGEAWVPAVLRTPPLGPLTWVEWRYDWPAVLGRHAFRVRATDGTGALQVGEAHDAYPDGATGYHAVTVTI
jgi:DMSO/TMAO reductase YedYZ molybdopterin-dependent catalytic subunit